MWTSKCLVPYRKQLFPSFNKKEKLLFSALYLPKCFCLEYAQYKNPRKECRQSLNYAIYKNNFMQHINWLVVIEINMIGINIRLTSVIERKELISIYKHIYQSNNTCTLMLYFLYIV